jgi:uncharacterized protein GlcG (DUF336 family)
MIAWEQAVTIAVAAKKNAQDLGLTTASVAVVNNFGAMLAGIDFEVLRIAEKIAKLAIILGMNTEEFRRRRDAGEEIYGHLEEEEGGISPPGNAFLVYDQEGIVGAVGLSGVRDADNARNIAFGAMVAAGFSSEPAPNRQGAISGGAETPAQPLRESGNGPGVATRRALLF